MQLVEQHIISKSDPRFAPIDEAAFTAKNLYNAANYLVRQAFIFEGRYMGYAAIFHLIKHHEAYTALPRKVSNDILRQLDKNWRAFFAACEAYREDPSKFIGRPKLPKYKHKTKGRFLLIYDLHSDFPPRSDAWQTPSMWPGYGVSAEASLYQASPHRSPHGLLCGGDGL